MVSKGAAGILDFSGLNQLNGDLIVADAGFVNGIASETLNAISGTFQLKNNTALNTLSMPSLHTVGSLDWNTLPQLDTLTFGTPGIQTAKSIVIGDTFLSSLKGIDVTSLDNLNINNCHRLQDLTLPLTNLSTELRLSFNGQRNDLKVSLPNLAWIANISASHTSLFEVPALKTVNGSIRFDKNLFTSFNAPNLTSIQTGDISFVSNNELKNLTFPQLTAMGGGLLVANNTKLDEVTSFPKLKTVGGAVKLRGNFTE